MCIVHVPLDGRPKRLGFNRLKACRQPLRCFFDICARGFYFFAFFVFVTVLLPRGILRVRQNERCPNAIENVCQRTGFLRHAYNGTVLWFRTHLMCVILIASTYLFLLFTIYCDIHTCTHGLLRYST